MSGAKTWDYNAVQKLRELWDKTNPQLSTAEIGRRLGFGKNAVISKSHRLNLDARPSPIKRGPAKILPPDAAGRITLPKLASAEYQPPSPSVESSAPAAWIAWCDGLSTSALNAIRRATHKGGCPIALQRKSLRLWECTCGVSQPGSDVVALASVPMVPKPAAIVVRRAPPAPVIAVEQTIFKPRRQEPCCWPTGQGRSIIFCDDLAEPGRPYCTKHGAKAYTKVRNWGFDDAKGDQPAA